MLRGYHPVFLLDVLPLSPQACGAGRERGQGGGEAEKQQKKLFGIFGILGFFELLKTRLQP